MRPTFCPGGASLRTVEGVSNMLMVTTTVGVLHRVHSHTTHLQDNALH